MLCRCRLSMLLKQRRGADLRQLRMTASITSTMGNGQAATAEACDYRLGVLTRGLTLKARFTFRGAKYCRQQLRKGQSMSNRKDGSNTARNDDGTFGPGNRGKPKGARHAITRAVEELLEGQAEVLTQKAVDRALEGDVTALRLCIDRIAPARKDAPVSFDLPSMQSALDARRPRRFCLRCQTVR